MMIEAAANSSRPLVPGLPPELAGRKIWAPNPGSQSLFLACPIYETLYEGTRGPGKTLGLLMDYAQDVGVGLGRGWRGILFRRTYKQLDDVVSKSRRFFHEVFPKARFNASDYVWSFPEGEQLLLRYMDKPEDYWNYHGHEYPWIGWEELTNWPNLECYDSMQSCSRWPSDISVPQAFYAKRRIRATCNPYGKGHNAVKRRFIDPAPAGVPVTEKGLTRVRIRGHWSENRQLLQTSPDYPEVLARDNNAERKKAWLDGSWDINAGGMFDDLWDEKKHTVRPFEIPKTWQIDRSMDWGSSKPFSIGWHAESDGTEAVLADGRKRSFPRGTLFQIAEWYGWSGKENEGCRMLAENVARGIKEREKSFAWGTRVRPGPADSSIFDVDEGDSIADKFARNGIRWETADKSPGSRKAGAEDLRTRFAALLDHPMEHPGLIFFDTCRHSIRTIATISRDEDDPDDVDSEAEDHAYDMTRYRCMFQRRRSTAGSLPFGGG
jgi:hypothetical protein